VTALTQADAARTDTPRGQTRQPGKTSDAPVPLLPGSLTWRDFGTHLFTLVLPQAFILQVSHPVINSAVTVEKKYLYDPWGRARGSLELLWPVVYSRPDRAIAMGHKLRELHRQIKGTDARGHKFHALDPEAYSWVHLTGFAATMTLHELFGAPLSAEERARHFDEWKQLGALLGIKPRFIPQTEQAYWQEYNRIIEQRLDADNEALRDLLDKDHFAKWPVHPALEGKLPRWLWRLLMTAPSRMAHIITKATLPERFREKAGLRLSGTDRFIFRAFVRLVRTLHPLVPEKYRYLPLAWEAIEDARQHPQAYRLPANT
jgi:uncharacterized protein (DUF2236 family)